MKAATARASLSTPCTANVGVGAAQPIDEPISEAPLALANVMLGAVNALLHSPAERRRAEF